MSTIEINRSGLNESFPSYTWFERRLRLNIETKKPQPKITIISSPTSFVTVTIEDRDWSVLWFGDIYDSYWWIGWIHFANFSGMCPPMLFFIPIAFETINRGLTRILGRKLLHKNRSEYDFIIIYGVFEWQNKLNLSFFYDFCPGAFKDRFGS